MGEGAKIPAHVAIIMDGNGRWAESRGRARVEGHAHGVESVRAALKSAVRNGVRYLTLYAFSTENWGRPQAEVDALMELLCQSIVNEAPELLRQGVAVRMIGGRERMPVKVISLIDKIEKETAGGDKLTLILAINYSSKSELVRAAQHLAREAVAHVLEPEDITPEMISGELYTAPWPEPDLLIRTGGEQRLSNFLLWQAAYAELYFTQTMWPDFRDEDFDKALAAYCERQRRYGVLKNKQE
ncbi:MAG: di-trans,poly-cis-decaprenylcistransferase [Rikenellaceae bacterium]|jgi:undecaprenyl diphosphate synthase|nr:di-trans,poly-cis-decaprenylcistransferase [Rikenellaceae bacterium]